MSSSTFPDDVRIAGSLTLGGELLPLRPRSSFEQNAVQVYPVPITDLRVWDAFQTALAAAADDDLGVGTGAFGTGLPYVSNGDSKAASTTRYARFQFTLPPEYDPQQTVQLRIAAGMLTTIADTSAVVDAECYLSARDTLKSGSDLVATAQQSINSLTFANYTFNVTATALAAGDTLDVRVKIAVVDAATGTAVTAALSHIEMLLDIKG
jgi:hypothetical protein